LNPDSTIDVPQGYGLGIHLDQKALKHATIHTLTMKA
jgi:hypothetical protein